MLRKIISRYNNTTPFYHTRISTPEEEVHYKSKTLGIELYIICTMYETEKVKRMYINRKMYEHCPLLLGATGNELLHDYIWKNATNNDGTKLINTWFVDKEVDTIMRRFGKRKAPYRMGKTERVLNILPNINYRDKMLILRLKYDKEILIDSTYACLEMLRNDTNVDNELINKYSLMMH